MKNSINDFRQTGRNTYSKDGKLYRLFGRGITPNGCWVICPAMKHVEDINVATGKDVYGETIELGIIGNVTDRYFLKKQQSED